MAIKIPPVRDYVERMTAQRERRLVTASNRLDEAAHRISALEKERDCLASEVRRYVEYTYQDGDAARVAALEIPTTYRQDFRSVYLLSISKAGSVLANNIFRDLFRECEIPVFDLPSHLFERGIAQQSFLCDLSRIFPERGYGFCGLRGVPAALLGSDALRRARKVLVVRDPRDVLVSMYFSLKFSHPFPTEATPQFSSFANLVRGDTGLEIDEFCLLYSCLVNAEFLHFRTITDENTRVLRYEDFVYDKSVIARSMCGWYALDVAEGRMAEIVRRYDVIPDIDQPQNHIRQVRPGDCHRKLKPKTIEILNGTFRMFMDTFRYSPDAT